MHSLSCCVSFLIHQVDWAPNSMQCMGSGVRHMHLTDDNCVFVSGHSYNVGLMKYADKVREGKSTRTRAKYLAYCSCKKDNSTLGWVTDPRISPSCIHVLAHITGFRSPGREGYKYDWLLGERYVVDPPIPLPKGVGRGIFFPTKNNNHLHTPFLALREMFSK